MQRGRGFTVVELVVVLVVMAILLTLASASITAAQKGSRNRERQADAEQIARGLEQRYVQGNAKITRTASNGTNYAVAGVYPGANEIRHILGENLSAQSYLPTFVDGGYVDEAMPGTTIDSVTAPGGIAGKSLIPYAGATSENDAYLTANLKIDNYIYEPLDSDNNPCPDGGCTHFNLYYLPEGGSRQTIRSERQ